MTDQSKRKNRTIREIIQLGREQLREGEQSEAVQHLLEAARGASLILESMCVSDINESLVTDGLARALQTAADEVDVFYFHSLPSDPNNCDVSRPAVAALLEDKLKKLRVQISKERAVQS